MQTPTLLQVPLQQQHYSYGTKFQGHGYQPRMNTDYQNNSNHAQQVVGHDFDGKRLRKAVVRKTVDYNSSVVKYLEGRIGQRDYRDRRAIQPDSGYCTEMTLPQATLDNPMNAVTTKFVHTAANKIRSPIFCMAWTPEGRRLVTGASRGEFTLWNGLTFNFETILQAHNSAVRCMIWSHDDAWMITGDHSGYVKYWQANMNNVKMFQAHKEPLRRISFSPLDTKFATCSDDCTVRIWDFVTGNEEKVLRGNGAEVKCVDWHPQRSLIVSGSKDSQQPVRLWDPKSGKSLATIQAHKNAVTETKWNENGSWLLTASRDNLIRLFDIRNLKEEVQTFRGHKKEVTTVAWHPIHESLFVSGGFDGALNFWIVESGKPVDVVEQAHDSSVWSVAWHPLGHVLCSGSNDSTSKFWTRNRPGDGMGTKSKEDSCENGAAFIEQQTSIPGLDLGLDDNESIKKSQVTMTTPFFKPIPNDFQQQSIFDSKPYEYRNNDQVYAERMTVIPGLDLILDGSMNSEETQMTRNTSLELIIPQEFQQKWMQNEQPLLLAAPSENKSNELLQPCKNHGINQSTDPLYNPEASSNRQRQEGLNHAGNNREIKINFSRSRNQQKRLRED